MNFSHKNKKIFLLLVLSVFTFAFFPSIASAEPVTIAIGTIILTGIITGIVTGAATVIADLATKTLTFLALWGGLETIVALTGWAMLDLGIQILNWTKGGIFLNWSMTNPASNKIIDIGWTLLRDMTNMFFILGLAYIGLATALNFANFNTKKTFTTLILIALLINFTPVICGVIVDASNIIMNFFLSEIDYSQMAAGYRAMEGGIEDINKDNLFSVSRIAKRNLLNLYSFGSGLILLIFAGILLIRNYIIWILVIVSPLAFFSRIFNFSQQWYKKWWSYFVSWSFIGLPGAFFLYLGNHLLVRLKSGQISGGSSDLTGIAGFGANITPYLLAMTFLIIALKSTLKINVAGSGIIMNTANKTAAKLKSVPGLVKSKMTAPMGAKLGALSKGAMAGAIYGKSAKSQAIAAGKSKKEARQAGIESGLKVMQENKRKAAAFRERMGFKPRELADLGPDELRELSKKPATTEEGLTRKIGAMKKMIADNNMDLIQLKEIAQTPAVGKSDGALRAQAIKKLIDDDNFEYNAADAKDMIDWMQTEYPGINIQKLKKARPDLIHLIDKVGFDRERARLGWIIGTPSNPALDAQARNTLIMQQSSKMSAEDFAKVPIEDIPHDVDGDEIIVHMFLGMDAGKVKSYGEKASTRRKDILKEIVTPGTDRFHVFQGLFAASTNAEKDRMQKLFNSVYDPNFL